jgi:hypothetical protein
MYFKMPHFQEMVKPLYGEMDRLVSLLEMGFTKEEVSFSVDCVGRSSLKLFNILSFNYYFYLIWSSPPLKDCLRYICQWIVYNVCW